MYRFANPTRFMAFAERWVWIAWLMTAVLLSCALYLIVYDTPPAELHGAMVRMLFIHVPSAWMALFCYSVMAVSSLVSLIYDTCRRHFGMATPRSAPSSRRLPCSQARFGVMRLGVPGGCER